MPDTSSADGTRISYGRTGRGPALIMIDAAGGFRGNSPLDTLGARLAEWFTVVTYDRRGRGASGDTGPYRVERELEDLAALVAATGGPAHLYGFSSGAVLALLAAAHGLPVGRLALLEPPLEFGAAPDAHVAAIEAMLAAGRRTEAVEYFLRDVVGVPAEYAAATPALVSVAHTLPYDLRVGAALTRDALAGIGQPSLLISSDASDARLLSWPARAAALMPHGEHRVLPGGWHGVPDEVLAPVLLDFLASG